VVAALTIVVAAATSAAVLLSLPHWLKSSRLTSTVPSIRRGGWLLLTAQALPFQAGPLCRSLAS
jgi:hypothetical protein